MKRLSGNLVLTAIVVLVLSAGFGYFFSWSNDASQRSYADDLRRFDSGTANLGSINDLSSAFREVARTLRPSVVSIQSVKTVRPALRRPNGARSQVPEELRGFFNDDLFDRFFEPNSPRQGFEQRGLGTGVIVSSDGLVVTNNHVVRGADEIDVRLHDGRSFVAEVKGTDAKTDVAVLKIQATGLTPARLGNSDDAVVGDWVLAIGSPFELDQTVTAGIISAKGRANVGILGNEGYEDFIQTDAAINPGNSGGPLVNMRGQVVGINTAIASRTGGSMGIGFAIPSNMVRVVSDAIVQYGHVERGRLGAAIRDLDEDIAQYLGHSSNKGALIVDVLPDSPAEKAGLKNEDIVVRFNGRAVENASQLRNTVAATAPNTRAELVIFRGGRQQSVSVVVGQLEEPSQVTAQATQSDASVSLGMTVVTLTPELAGRLGSEPNEQGVVVTDVEVGSLAARAGIRKQDVIVGVGRTPVTDVREFQEAMDGQQVERGFPLHVRRNGARLYVFLKSR